MGDIELGNRFSIQYRGPARGRDYDEWRENICRAFCRLDIGPADTDYVDCQNELALLHTLSLAAPNGTSARFSRTRDLHNDGCDDLVLISATRGSICVTRGSKAIELSAGQMCITEMDRVGQLDLTGACGFTATRIPRRLLLEVSPSAETQLATPLGHEPALRSMINRYFALCIDVAQDLDALGQKMAADHLVNLVGHLVGTTAERKERIEPRSYAAVRFELMKSKILDELDRRDLTIEAVARENGLSERQAQRLFAESGTTFSEFVLEQRLSLARRLLGDVSNRNRKISDIAYAAGFGDLSYFNRTFRRRFDRTPSDVQSDACEGNEN